MYVIYVKGGAFVVSKQYKLQNMKLNIVTTVYEVATI